MTTTGGDGSGSSELVVAEHGRPRVLVADDERILLRAVVRVLERAGFDVDTAEDGQQALHLIDQRPFDAVLTDVTMPGTSGIQLLRAVRERDLEVPVVLMTGDTNTDSASQAVRYGACDYMTKPFGNQQLERTIRRAVGMSRLARTKREAMRMLATGRPEAGDRAGLEVTLDRALDSMWMAYQPIVDARTYDTFAYEAFLRTEEESLPNPPAVLDAAERLGRIHDVGRTVRRKAPEPMSDAPPSSLLFVNVHAAELNDGGLASTSTPLGAIATRVVLEVTERAALDGVDGLRARVARLREVGFRIAVDDLGAGYAGLSSFFALEPAFVKLDIALVRDIHSSPIKRRIVRCLTAQCRELGIQVVAEGVESSAERDALADSGCDLLQGHLFARPGAAFPEISPQLSTQ